MLLEFKNRSFLAIKTSSFFVEVSVMDNGEFHALVFPCRKSGPEWVDASTQKRIDIQPTHWRAWGEHH